jgi:hypothetical protein
MLSRSKKNQDKMSRLFIRVILILDCLQFFQLLINQALTLKFRDLVFLLLQKKAEKQQKKLLINKL